MHAGYGDWLLNSPVLPQAYIGQMNLENFVDLCSNLFCLGSAAYKIEKYTDPLHGALKTFSSPTLPCQTAWLGAARDLPGMCLTTFSFACKQSRPLCFRDKTLVWQPGITAPFPKAAPNTMGWALFTYYFEILVNYNISSNINSNHALICFDTRHGFCTQTFPVIQTLAEGWRCSLISNWESRREPHKHTFLLGKLYSSELQKNFQIFP